MKHSWNKFISKSRGSSPAPLVLKAIGLSRRGGKALDLGAGAGANALALANAGFDVEAVDSDASGIRELRRLGRNRAILPLRIDMSELRRPRDMYDLIVAWNSLSFLIPKGKIKTMLRRIQSWLKPGGLAAISVFGPEDEWAVNGKRMSFLAVREVKAAWPEMRLLKLDEIRRRGPTVAGDEKLWHIVRCVARKVRPGTRRYPKGQTAVRRRSLTGPS